MKPLSVAEDFLPLSEFKAQASRAMRRVQHEGRPLVITVSGKPAAVLIPPEEYDRLVDHQRVAAAIQRGLDDAAAGRVVDDDALGDDFP